VLKPFRDRVSARVKKEFDTGIASLMASDYSNAEATLKRAIRPDVESMAAMVYLAVTFAASGHDTEAAAAWQIALTDGSDLPQIYEWLSQALLRTDRLPEARAILEEAIGKWPSDPRFTGPLAAMYAMFGQGREAIATLQRYLTARPDDSEAFRLGVEWIYQAHVSGQVVHTDVEDLKLARAYAGAYTKVNRAQAELVKLWLSFLDNEKR
jgi:predicted Zn-dependent protease